ncbi:hypothetical protein NQ317_010415, partial [Molorchus minor]
MSNIIKFTPREVCLFKRHLCQKPLDVNTNVTKDVILYKYKNGKFYKIINIFAICQFGFLDLLLRDAPVDSTEDAKWWQKINLGENKYRNTIAILTFLIGWGILATTWIFSLKSVKYLILLKGGKVVTVVTYTPTGHNRMFTLGLENLNCKESRTAAKTQLPIKLKGHYLYYILDMRGEFTNPSLFDATAGLKRNWTSRCGKTNSAVAMGDYIRYGGDSNLGGDSLCP